MTDCSFYTTLVTTRIQYLSFVIAQTCDSAKTMASLTQFFFYAEVERHQSKAWHLQSVHCSPTSIDLNREGEEWTLDMGGSKHVSFDASHFQSMSCLLYIMLWKCCIEYLVRSKDLSTEDHFVVVYKYCLMLLWWKKGIYTQRSSSFGIGKKRMVAILFRNCDCDPDTWVRWQTNKICFVKIDLISLPLWKSQGELRTLMICLWVHCEQAAATHS